MHVAYYPDVVMVTALNQPSLVIPIQTSVTDTFIKIEVDFPCTLIKLPNMNIEGEMKPAAAAATAAPTKKRDTDATKRGRPSLYPRGHVLYYFKHCPYHTEKLNYRAYYTHQEVVEKNTEQHTHHNRMKKGTQFSSYQFHHHKHSMSLVYRFIIS